MQDLNIEMRFLIDQIIDNLGTNGQSLISSNSISSGALQNNEMLRENYEIINAPNGKCEFRKNASDLIKFKAKVLCQAYTGLEEMRLWGDDFFIRANMIRARVSPSNIKVGHYHLYCKGLKETIDVYDMSLIKSFTTAKTVRDASVQTMNPWVAVDKHCQCNLNRINESVFMLEDDPTGKKRKLNDPATRHSDDHSTSLLLKSNPRIRVGLSKRFKSRPIVNKLLFSDEEL